MALFGPSLGRSSAASCSQSFSASGSGVTQFSKVLLQDQLRSDGVDRLVFYAAQAAFRFDRVEALIDARHRQSKASLELAREALHAPCQRMLAVRGDGQPDDDLCWPPFANQFRNGLKPRGGNRGQRVRRAELRLADCYPDTL